MRIWRNRTFWGWFILLLVPVQIVMALPGMILLDDENSGVKIVTMLVSQQVIAWLLPIALARRIALHQFERSQLVRGFPVILETGSGPEAV